MCDDVEGASKYSPLKQRTGREGARMSGAGEKSLKIGMGSRKREERSGYLAGGGGVDGRGLVEGLEVREGGAMLERRYGKASPIRPPQKRRGYPRPLSHMENLLFTKEVICRKGGDWRSPIRKERVVNTRLKSRKGKGDESEARSGKKKKKCRVLT